MPNTTDFNVLRGTAVITIPAGGSVSTIAAMGGCTLRAFVPTTYSASSGTIAIYCAPTGFDGTVYPMVSLHQQKSGNVGYFEGTTAFVQGINAGTYYSFDTSDNFGAMVQFVNFGTLSTAGTFVIIGKAP